MATHIDPVEERGGEGRREERGEERGGGKGGREGEGIYGCGI